MSFGIGIAHDPVIICPYDGNHRIAKSRIQRHLVKCEKNFPPDYKKQCPYDATHRIFEHEMIEHVKNCPMKYTCPIEIGQSKPVTPDISMQKENKANCDDEVWDDDTSIGSDLDEELVFKRKSNMFIVKQVRRPGHQLRRPFGYSESLMLESSNFDTDEDAQSVTSDQGIGRGRRITPGAYSGQYQRGTNQVYRRGIRGRLTH